MNQLPLADDGDALDKVVELFMSASPEQHALLLYETRCRLAELPTAVIVTILVMSKGEKHPFLAACRDILFELAEKEFLGRDKTKTLLLGLH